MTTLIIHPDLDCKVYIDAELHGSAVAGEDYAISLGQGDYNVECISLEDDNIDCINFELHIDDTNVVKLHNIQLKPIRYKRLMKRWDIVESYSEDLALVRERWHYADWREYHCGYINKDGDLVIVPKYNDATSFQNGYACVNIGAEISRTGSVIGGTWGFIDKEGREITPLKYNGVKPFREDLAAVNMGGFTEYGDTDGGKWGFVNEKGNVVIPIVYDYVDSFAGGLAKVELHNKKFQINRDGVKVKDGWD